MRHLVSIVISGILLATFNSCSVKEIEMSTVYPSVETSPVPSSDDAADDPAIWIHPTQPAKSKIIGTNKKEGLAIYDLSGKQVNYFKVGAINNVDIRYNFPLGNEKIDIVAGSNRTSNSISIFRFDGDSNLLSDISARTLTPNIKEVYGFCLYRNVDSNKYYACVVGSNGKFEQYLLFANDSNYIDYKLVREFKLDSKTEGMVADDEFGYLYIAQENYGIWKYHADPINTNRKSIIDTTSKIVVPDIEGLSIYYAADKKGYLLASIQGNHSYAIFTRNHLNEYLGSFKIKATEHIDGAEETDGIDVANYNFGDQFPNGFFIAQDGYNYEGEKQINQNFKLVKWEDIARQKNLNLMIDNTFNVRKL